MNKIGLFFLPVYFKCATKINFNAASTHFSESKIMKCYVVCHQFTGK